MSKNKGKHQSKLDTLCQLPPDLPAIQAYLKELNTQAQYVAANSNDYPKQTISADVWRDGYQIVNTGPRPGRMARAAKALRAFAASH